LQRPGIDGIGLEVAHITPFGDRPVNGISLGIAESKEGISHDVTSGSQPAWMPGPH
jgi:hypothetical protein